MYRLQVKHSNNDEKSELFIEMYDRHVDSIYRFILLKVSNKDLAWDITQECFLKIWQYQKDSESEIKNYRAFLFSIARNLIIDHWRRKDKTTTVDLEEVAFALKDSGNLHEETSTKHEALELMEFINQLPEHQKEILLLRYIEDLPFSEIAKIIGKSAVSARVEAHRAIKKVKKLTGNEQKHQKQI